MVANKEIEKPFLNPGDTVLITGANGLLATNIIHDLLQRGYYVKGLLRDKTKYQGKAHSRLELWETQLRHKEEIQSLLKDCQAIIHTAALTRQDLSNYQSYYRVNVEITRKLLESAIAENLVRFIYVGSANTFGHGTKAAPGSETLPPRRPFTGSLYAQSKSSATKLVLEASGQISTAVVSPTFMLGAYGNGQGSDQILKRGMKKNFVFYPPGGKNFIHAEDAATAINEIMEKAASGEAWLISNENHSFREFFQKARNHSPHNPLLIQVPAFVLKSAGVLGEALHFLGISSSLSLSNMRILCEGNYYTSEKAHRFMPDRLKNLDTMIKDTQAWLEKTGKL